MSRNTTARTSCAELLRSAARLVRSWWNVDRIRLSPNEGRLLRLHPPCLVTIDGRPIEVIRRVVGQTQQGPAATYECTCEGQPVQLHVQTNVNGQHEIRFVSNALSEQLPQDAVLVLG